MSIEINEQFRKALELIESGKNVFVTGRAGTGKSTLLEHFRDTTKKSAVVLAPTGVAALNVNGQTIHSFFKFGTDITPEKVKRCRYHDKRLYKSLEAIVIDEISMVRADMLDCIDRFLRINGPKIHTPFGGVQMIFFGDLLQLPPVVSRKESEAFRNFYASQYFFDSRSYPTLKIELIELEKIYRQKDQEFIGMLNSIRDGSITEEQLKRLNARVDPRFMPKAGDFCISLTTTNEMANEINEAELARLPSKSHSFAGKMSGEFDLRYMPTETNLTVKPGAQVMMVSNDPLGRWVNGTVGRIKSIESRAHRDGIAEAIVLELPDKETHEVLPYTWNMNRTFYNPESKKIESEPVGSFIQYPLRLAWAVTIHKSQGKTFKNVIIDIGSGAFSHGQVYVALSRCTRLEGIVLRRPIKRGHIFTDWKVKRFLEGCHEGNAGGTSGSGGGASIKDKDDGEQASEQAEEEQHSDRIKDKIVTVYRRTEYDEHGKY
jgi:ATP-dependent exoDNAse (exonuclease V) alpha subunit